MNGRASVFGALALELSSASEPACQWLAQRDAGALAELVARDLARLDPAAATLQLAMSGAHCDAVELLRPGWPLHVALDQLAAGAPQRDADHGRIVAFGSHDGRFPPVLAPSAEYAGGPLRLLPFVLSGDADTAAAVGEAFESDLLESGMAGADTALAAQDLFGLRIEHARYLTLHDLAAMMALQYEHAGLAVLWPILEAALLAPSSEEWLDAASEPLLHFADGEARMALLSPAAWAARNVDTGLDGKRLERGFAHFQARQRQFAAVLAAHAVPVLFVHCASGERDGL
ncbi:hypothetical protein [Cognatiluteimonas profundi]|uniref:hypothetical protein n=1 Tax=Cognatiluteimonas profundi TaxID=2594501 RepID=UPI00131E85FB|nr:hypothetical protein [Lysobacter profundi]